MLTTDFRFTCMLSCMFIPRKCQWRNIFQIQEHFLRTRRKCQLQYQSQNIGLDLFTYVQNISNRNEKKQTTHPTINLEYFAKIF